MNKRYGRHIVTITHPEKLLLGKYTKLDLINYYEAISLSMVPYMKDHPLMMQRYPEGLSGESFYQKDAGSYFPEWIKKITVPKRDGSFNAVVCQNPATLIYIANQGCITPHLWLSKTDKLSVPDRIIFDLDPSDEDFSKVRHLALALKKLLDSLKLESFVMTSGSKGLHIYVPLRRSVDFTFTKEFSYQCATILLNEHSDIATTELRKDKRGDKVFIDYLRNQEGATAVAPYSVRAKITAPIATPLFWDEVENKKLNPQQYTIANIFKRLSTTEDPWKSFFSKKQSITNLLSIISKQ